MKTLTLLLLLIGLSAQAMTMNLSHMFVSQSMGASIPCSVNNSTNVGNVDLVGIQLVWAGGGSPVGSFEVDTSDDDVSPVTFSTYPGSSLAINADGDLSYNIAVFGHKWICIKYTRTSGTATLNANLVTKKEGN